MNAKKYLMGFLVFLAYYLVAENLKNKVSIVNKLSNFGSSGS
jgi:hypothetical protein